jgi:hypothetical protein
MQSGDGRLARQAVGWPGGDARRSIVRRSIVQRSIAQRFTD